MFQQLANLALQDFGSACGWVSHGKACGQQIDILLRGMSQCHVFDIKSSLERLSPKLGNAFWHKEILIQTHIGW